MNKHKIFIVEDDEITSLNLNISLQKQGYRVVGVYDNIDQAQNKIGISKPDLVIIDISLDDSDDGIKLAELIKQKYNIPFIYLTSYSDDDIINKAKLTEPYGYIVKPFEPGSLHATIQMALFKFQQENEYKKNPATQLLDESKIKKLLHSKCISGSGIISFGGDYHLDINLFEIFYKNKNIKLTKKENSFLSLLISQLEIVVNFDQIMTYVWSEKKASENSVRTLVWRLRSKLPTDIIKSASGIGYYIQE